MELSKRDKNVLAAGAVFLVIFCAFQFVYFPAVDRREQLEHIYQSQDIAIEQMREIAGTQQDISRKLDRQNLYLKHRDKNFTLFSFLDMLAEKSGVKKNVAYMKPLSQEYDNETYKISKVKVKLGGVYLKGLVEFLSLIESSQNGVVITSLSLNKSGKNGKKMDAVIETQTLALKGDVK